jgi:hypothetical protein
MLFRVFLPAQPVGMAAEAIDQMILGAACFNGTRMESYRVCGYRMRQRGDRRRRRVRDLGLSRNKLKNGCLFALFAWPGSARIADVFGGKRGSVGNSGPKSTVELFDGSW